MEHLRIFAPQPAHCKKSVSADEHAGRSVAVYNRNDLARFDHYAVKN